MAAGGGELSMNDEWKEHIVPDAEIVSWFPRGFLLHLESLR